MSGKRERASTVRPSGRRQANDAPRTAHRAPLPGAEAKVPTCQRCGFPVQSRAWGCKNPCPNCGTVYPLGDCSD